MHFFIGEPLFLSIAYGLNLETGKLASSDGFVAAAAIGQIGMFGTGIFNIVTMFFGGIWPKHLGRWRLFFCDSEVLIETNGAMGSRKTSTKVCSRVMRNMRNEFASNKNRVVANHGRILATLADHLSTLFCVAIYGVLAYLIFTSKWGSHSTEIPYLLRS